MCIRDRYMVYTHYIGHTHTHVFMNTGTCLSPPSIANGRIVSVDPDAVTSNPDRYEQGSVATYTAVVVTYWLEQVRELVKAMGSGQEARIHPHASVRKPIFRVN